MAPTVGQSVHFVQNGHHFAAIVTHVWSPECVNLHVPRTNAIEPIPGSVDGHGNATSVPLSLSHKEWSWHPIEVEPDTRPGIAEAQEAISLVYGDRQGDYGTPRENYAGIAKVWSGLLGHVLSRDLTPEEAALMMVGLKLQRQSIKHKRDNLVDAHGYLLVYARVAAEGQ